MDTGARGVDGMIALSSATVDEPETESVINPRRQWAATVTEQRLTTPCATTAWTPVNVRNIFVAR